MLLVIPTMTYAEKVPVVVSLDRSGKRWVLSFEWLGFDSQLG